MRPGVGPTTNGSTRAVHAEQALSLLFEAYNSWGEPTEAIAAAQVQATLAVAAAVEALQKALTAAAATGPALHSIDPRSAA